MKTPTTQHTPVVRCKRCIPEIYFKAVKVSLKHANILNVLKWCFFSSPCIYIKHFAHCVASLAIANWTLAVS